jgi:choline dehydrogenase-like flavoprotein
MYQEKWRKGMPFGYYGDPHNVKWSSRMYVATAKEQGAVLVNRAKVTRVLIKKGKAIGVEYQQKGRSRSVLGELVVIAAGGIGSPVILRNSGIPEAGYDFFFDPLVSVCGVVDNIRAQAEIPMSAGLHFQDEGYVMTDMSLPPALDTFFSGQALRFHRLFDQPRTLRIMIKIRDGLGGHITGRGQVRKRLKEDDLKKLRQGSKRAKRILEHAGARGIFRTGYVAAHPGGTVKIGEILDSDLKTKKFDNLYVCDCSVIPEAWGLPPTMTLICLGKRLAKHLA